MRANTLLSINLAATISFTGLFTYLLIHKGFSASLLIILIIITALCSQLFSLFKHQQKQAEMVIRALANGDSTLGLGPDSTMRQYYLQVKDQMQVARFNAEQQAQFFQALLIHIDLAVLVCDESGQVVEANPAASRLLGKSIKHLSELGSVGSLILAAENNLRTTTDWQLGEHNDTLAIQTSIAQIQGEVRRVVSLQSIKIDLQMKEQQAYKRLTQVLTHEIANSITPLASLAQTCTSLLPNELSFSDADEKKDLELALNTFASRAQHLGEFIARFRQISSLPKPNLASQNLAELLERIQTLYQQQAERQDIELNVNILTQQLVMLDCAQIEQVFVNLVKNSLEVLSQQCYINNENSEGKTITLTLGQNSNQQLYVEVADNGPGIAEHVIDMIFVPFFTTKQQGSGIGLSLSRKVMLNHGGDLIYISHDQGACFRCVFG